MVLLVKICTLVCFLSFVSGDIHQLSNFEGCSFRMHGHHEKNTPLILSNSSSSYDFIMTRCGIVKLLQNETAMFTCPGEGNHLNTKHEDQSMVVKCTKGKQLLLNNQVVHYEDLECKKPITGSVQETGIKCGNGSGHIANIGYYVNENSSFISLIKICYNNHTGNTIYAEHTLHGGEIRHASKVTYKPPFSSEAIPKNIKFSEIYKPTYQKHHISEIFNFTSIGNKYINDKLYFSKTMLAPSNDFPFAAWKFASYHNINTAPQFHPIKTGNWQILENMIRKSANLYREELKIITGAHGIIKLKSEAGDFKPIYLGQDNMVAVPEYFYKIIYYEHSQKSIVIVVSNNPFLKEVKQEDKICESVCEKTGWVTKFWENYSKGFVQCCEYQDFVKNVPTAPIIPVDGVLRGMYQI